MSSGYESSPGPPSMNLELNWTVCKKLFTSALDLGGSQFWMTAHFSGFGDTPCFEKIFPNHFTSGYPS